ncbi:hypothetical protein PCE1_004224 [Barthelona sp. PCE]
MSDTHVEPVDEVLDDVIEETTFEDYEAAPIEQVEEEVEEEDSRFPLKNTPDLAVISSFQDALMNAPNLLRNLSSAGFEAPSEIQSKALCPSMFGDDLIGQAKSGMGKTAVFVLGILYSLTVNTEKYVDAEDKIKAVVIAPTRELVIQIGKEFERFAPGTRVRTTSIIGGRAERFDLRELEYGKPDIVVSTPGRILGFIRDKKIDLGHVRHFVLDEFDKMLIEPSMRQDVQDIFISTPQEKQTMMFSATLPEEIEELAVQFFPALPSVVKIEDSRQLTLNELSQYSITVAKEQKVDRLLDLLDALDFNQVVIFVGATSQSHKLKRLLREKNIPATCVNGSMSQKARASIFKKFKAFEERVLVSTDLYSRGVDIEYVTLVINFDMPKDCECYMHRVGRAGRFGTRGLAISFVEPGEQEEMLQTIRTTFGIEIPELVDEIDSSIFLKK